MKKTILLIMIGVALVFAACEKEEFIPEQNTTTLAKTWFVKMQGSASSYTVFSTRSTYYYDTARIAYFQHTDTIQLDDHNFLNPTMRANVRVDITTLSFGAGTYFNYNNNSDSVILKEGKIVIHGGRSKSGKTVDSIYFRYALKSAPATDHIISGHSRTGFMEDEY